MNITENIITDLLPAYFSGEASNDTIELVKQYLLENPSFNTGLETIELNETKSKNHNQTADFSLLLRTKNMMKIKSIFMSIAIFFSALPFASYGEVNSMNDFTFTWAFESNPEIASLFIAIAVTFWMLFLRIHKKLNVVGM